MLESSADGERLVISILIKSFFSIKIIISALVKIFLIIFINLVQSSQYQSV